MNKIKRFYFILLKKLIPTKWRLESLWFKIPAIRKLAIRTLFKDISILNDDRFEFKLNKIDVLISQFISAQSKALLFTEKQQAAKKFKHHIFYSIFNSLISKVNSYLGPNTSFINHCKLFLMQCSIAEKEKHFYLYDIMDLEKQQRKKQKLLPKKKHKNVFTPKKVEAISKFLPVNYEHHQIAVSYIKHFFPLFNSKQFIKQKAQHKNDYKPLFSVNEIESITTFLNGRLIINNPSFKIQRGFIFLKKAAVAFVLALLLFPLFLDMSVFLLGLDRNEYYNTNHSGKLIIETMDSPFTRRLLRIQKRSTSLKYKNFSHNPFDDLPYNYKIIINNKKQLAVELNFDIYKKTRLLDQKGSTIVSFDESRINTLKKEDTKLYTSLLHSFIQFTVLEKIGQYIDVKGNFDIRFFNINTIPINRIKHDISKKIALSPTPLKTIQMINNIYPVIDVIYHKPNTRKWMSLSELPYIMKRAIILREDKRFYNNLFPIAHRGNDNLVLVPIVFKKMTLKGLQKINTYAQKSEAYWLAQKSSYYSTLLHNSLIKSYRGGSTITNQVIEMLYTRYVPRISQKRTLHDRQIEQKRHELPASIALSWAWTKDQILESYINEVYGGFLHDHIIGFKSQCENYFSKPLFKLNLREMVLLVGAVKKPSLIKDYAEWVKAKEFKEFYKKNKYKRKVIKQWEKSNSIYGITSKNYKEILKQNHKSMKWINNRINYILWMLYNNKDISKEIYISALKKQKIHFNFSPEIYMPDEQLVNKIKIELDDQLASSDTGEIVFTTINMTMQKKVQKIIDKTAKKIWVSPDKALPGQPLIVSLNGGARIIKAKDNSRVYNTIIADIGSSTNSETKWDWISQANRSLGSSLKPFADLLFLLQGYNLNDMFIDKKITYESYTPEQQRIYKKYMRKYPHKYKEIRGIKKNWFWTPVNIFNYTNKWITVSDALAHSVNSVHVQIQEIIEPKNFAALLNELMTIERDSELHKPFRSLILGGSNGDQRYNNYLQAFSLFANSGILKKLTYIDMVQFSDYSKTSPEYRVLSSSVLNQYNQKTVEAAVLLINYAMRQAVKKGTLFPLGGIGCGKTGTSNYYRDTISTAHFESNNTTYIAGIRLGNIKNYSIGKPSYILSTPILKKIILSNFPKDSILIGKDYDNKLKNRLATHPHIVHSNDNYYLLGSTYKSRKLNLKELIQEKRLTLLLVGDRYFKTKNFKEAATHYEGYIAINPYFDYKHPVFNRIIKCYVFIHNIQRIQQLITHFTDHNHTGRIAAKIARKYNLKLIINYKTYGNTGGSISYNNNKQKSNSASLLAGR